MSTKIYDGMRLKENVNVFTLNQIFLDLKKKANEIVQEEFLRLNAKMLEGLYVYKKTGVDNDQLFGLSVDGLNIDSMNYQELAEFSINLVVDLIQKATKSIRTFESYSFLAPKEFAKENNKSTVVTMKNHKGKTAEMILSHHPLMTTYEMAFDASISVLPLEDKILIIPFSNNEKLKDMITHYPAFEEYGYWNNVDPLETVSEEEWNQREIDWNKALTGIGIPSQCGFTLNLLDEKDPLWDVKKGFNMQTLEKYFMSSETLSYNVARLKKLNAIYEQEAKKLEPGDYVEALSAARRRMKDEDVKKEIEQDAKRYSSCLNIMEDFGDTFVSHPFSESKYFKTIDKLERIV